MTADTLGGVWGYALELCRALGDGGLEVLLAAMGEKLRPDQRQQVAAVSCVRLAESDYKLEWMGEPWEEVDAAGEWLLELAGRFAPDVVHLNGYAHGMLDFGVPKVVVAHSCVVSWWEAVRQTSLPPEWGEYRRRVWAGLAGADLVVAPTRAMLEAIWRHYGVVAEGAVIHNGRRPEDYVPGPKGEVILSAGRLWDEAKGIERLVGVGQSLPWPVWLAGECAGPDGQKLHPGNVRVLGRLSEREMAACYRQAAIYALPARYEPFGLSVLEAALSGCALVLGDIPSLRELWDSAAVFVPPEDGAALREALLTLIRQPERRHWLSRRARGRAMIMSSERMGRQYLAAYTHLLGREAWGKEAEPEGISLVRPDAAGSTAGLANIF